MDQAYLKNRDRGFINRYKLTRRAEEISEAINNLTSGKELSLLDVGSADGSLLCFFNNRLKIKQSVGIEPSLDCIRLRVAKDLNLIVAVAETIPFSSHSFDVIVAASVIDHLKDVSKFLKESQRVLRKNGLLVITAVIPFYDKMANVFGIDKGLHPHIKTFSLCEIKETLRLHNFKVILAKRFALPSFGLMPFERQIEFVFEKIHLNQIMFYSLLIGQKE